MARSQQINVRLDLTNHEHVRQTVAELVRINTEMHAELMEERRKNRRLRKRLRNSRDSN